MKTIDQNFYWSVLGHWENQCRVQIFAPHPEQTIIVLTDTGNLKLRDAVPQILPVILQDYDLDPTISSWIEQYPSKRELHPQAEFWWLNPRWKQINVERRVYCLAEAYWNHIARSEVEALLGQVF
jgi:hypothetical protein